ncbi:uncharacterized protein LOC106642196 [Copidosoma floridanum]|uniref:uncharacterized protein LOC106642196 n=1 Tax=Copidosoma floridanum TaxID=29053 RepID=UPI0006C9971C|nr:uncharacterized protein LOC106642196 [Copidosoma floridanum]
MAQCSASTFKIGHINAQSLEPHFIDIKKHSNLLNIEGYQLLRVDRSGRAGGVVAAYVSTAYRGEIVGRSVYRPGGPVRHMAQCTDARMLWHCIDEIGMRVKERSTDGIFVDVESLNAHFADCGNAIDTPHVVQAPILRHMGDGFYFHHVTQIDVLDALVSIGLNARGLDDLPISLIKGCVPAILPVLLHIFDLSLQSAIFPSRWKRAIVHPIPKRFPPRSLDDRRPISITCALSKLLEFVALRQIDEFVRHEQLVDPLQSGFRRGHSAHSALLQIVDGVRRAVDNKMITSMISVDFARAFDLVNVELLVYKLVALGFSLLAAGWIRSFLTGRSQSGCQLSPLLFVLFINDAPLVLHYCYYHMYAADFTLWRSGPRDEVVRKVGDANFDLEALSRNFITNLDLERLPVLRVLNILRVLIDSTLSGLYQTIATVRKYFAALIRLRECGDFLLRVVRLTLVKALIFPYLDYCPGLFLDLSLELWTKLRQCKNAALRFVTGTRIHQHITPVYRQLRVLGYEDNRDYHFLCLLADVLCHGEPSYLRECLQFISVDGPGSKRRSKIDLIIPHARTECFKHSFTVYTSRLWNDLPVVLRRRARKPSIQDTFTGALPLCFSSQC